MPSPPASPHHPVAPADRCVRAERRGSSPRRSVRRSVRRAFWLATAALLAVATAGCAAQSPAATVRSPAGSPSRAAQASQPNAAGPAVGPGVTPPPVGARFSYQIGGTYAVPAGVTVVDRDRTAASVRGVYSICYVNAFQAQPDAVGWWQQHHDSLLLRKNGKLVMDTDWNEPLLDLRRSADLLAVIGTWLDGCAASGYRAVEADNLDSYTRSAGLLSDHDALAFGRLLAVRAHRDHLALAQKNAAELSSAAHAAGFDFAIAEECQVYSECASYTRVYGRHLIEIEYTDESERFFRTACAARGTQVSVVRRDRDVAPAGDPAHVEQWC